MVYARQRECSGRARKSASAVPPRLVTWPKTLVVTPTSAPAAAARARPTPPPLRFGGELDLSGRGTFAAMTSLTHASSPRPGAWQASPTQGQRGALCVAGAALLAARGAHGPRLAGSATPSHRV